MNLKHYEKGTGQGQQVRNMKCKWYLYATERISLMHVKDLIPALLHAQWCTLKWERLQNISYEEKENASVQGQDKIAEPAAFNSTCNFTVPKKHGPEEPGHLLHFSV